MDLFVCFLLIFVAGFFLLVVLDINLGKELLEVFVVVLLGVVFFFFFGFVWSLWYNGPVQSIHEFLHIRIAVSLHKGVFVSSKTHDQISVEEDTVTPDHIRNVRDWCDIQRGPHYQQHIRLWDVLLQKLVKAFRKLFSEKDNVGLDVSPAILALGCLPVLDNGFSNLVGIRRALAVNTRGRSKVPMAFHEFVLGDSRQKFKPVNVL